MKNDLIVEEIRNYRLTHAAKYGNDLNRIFTASKEKEKKHLHRLINREVKPVLHENTG